MNKFLAPNIKLVKGSEFSIILDNQFGEFYRIPTFIVRQCFAQDKLGIRFIDTEVGEELYNLLDKEHMLTSLEVLKLCNLNEVQHTDTSTLENAIVVGKALMKYDFLILHKCVNLGVRAIVLHLDGSETTIFLARLVAELKSIYPTRITLYLQIVSGKLSLAKYLDLFKLPQVTSATLVANSDASFFDQTILQNTNLPVAFVNANFSSLNYCGAVNVSYFNTTETHFTEAHHHNTCLNRKVAIDADGNIKNCPSLPEVYGNIATDDLAVVVSTPQFQKYWNIKKDEIAKCKDCEFRYICTDCRAYRDNPNDLNSAPLKCGYDPYTGTWEEWSTNPLKQQAINYYGMAELVVERQQRIAAKAQEDANTNTKHTK